MSEDKPFGAEFLEELKPSEELFGANGTSVCTGYVTFIGTSTVDHGSDGCSSD
jgi:hypothetical protein